MVPAGAHIHTHGHKTGKLIKPGNLLLLILPTVDSFHFLPAVEFSSVPIDRQLIFVFFQDFVAVFWLGALIHLKLLCEKKLDI